MVKKRIKSIQTRYVRMFERDYIFHCLSCSFENIVYTSLYIDSQRNQWTLYIRTLDENEDKFFDIHEGFYEFFTHVRKLNDRHKIHST